jgi:SAM-dependent methyltransferase
MCGNSIRAYGSHGGGAEVLDRRCVVGGMLRKDDRCPVCHARDRTRLMMLCLQLRTELGHKSMRVLHTAPDFGLYLWLRNQPLVEYVATDIDSSRYRHIENMRDADLTSTSFSDNSFDIILCSHVLEHIPDDTAAFSELFRILRPGGHALLLTPFALDGLPTDEDPTINDPAEQNRRFGQWDHVRIYSRDDFVARMERAGFVTELFDPLKSDPDAAAPMRLNPDELLPVGRKPIAS